MARKYFHSIGRKLKKSFNFSKHQWIVIAVIGIALLAYFLYHHNQSMKMVLREEGGIPGCVEAAKRRNGSFKCVQCEDGYRMSRGKCVERR